MLNIYTNKAIITRTSPTYKLSGKPDIRALICEYTRLINRYNELARKHNLQIETPINIRKLYNINDELLMAHIIRLRRAIMHLNISSDDSIKPGRGPNTFEVIGTVEIESIPTMNSTKPYEGFILAGWFYCLMNDGSNRLLCAPTYQIDSLDPNYDKQITALYKNLTEPWEIPFDYVYFNVQNNDEPIIYEVYARIHIDGTPISNDDRLESTDFDGSIFQVDPKTIDDSFIIGKE